MSDTPRTDAIARMMPEPTKIEGRFVYTGTAVEVVSAEEMRTLERELAAQEVQMKAVRYRAQQAESALLARDAACVERCQADERKAFEEWYEADAMPQESDWFRRDPDDPEEYKHVSTAWSWHGWQGRARLRTLPVG